MSPDAAEVSPKRYCMLLCSFEDISFDLSYLLTYPRTVTYVVGHFISPHGQFAKQTTRHDSGHYREAYPRKCWLASAVSHDGHSVVAPEAGGSRKTSEGLANGRVRPWFVQGKQACVCALCHSNLRLSLILAHTSGDERGSQADMRAGGRRPSTGSSALATSQWARPLPYHACPHLLREAEALFVMF
ncbi:hypothetical protein PYCCODRAFT_145562 [Trametes coccinea BRFM310]|uniref:Uncharacterized protein n=1 Tax=Trametes coccinea (strain BRFM310) TaxID=1353009 RepID=A0A1Y2IUK9_TRAC3|nr:hypothetical protein PYCCODRAFT_145562 [Trametes coccinea BRFM310]